MFTGIIESLGKVKTITKGGSNVHFIVESPFTHELKIDQSIAHNGACLTVVEVMDDAYRVTAIDETLQRTNLGLLKPGEEINLERCLKIGNRFDGHIVQGHVDETATCISKEEKNGSWIFAFEYAKGSKNITIEKGSICVNGVSLTIVDSGKNQFSVAIIPFTFENTNFRNLNPGSTVNLEFDVVGKYVARLFEQNQN
ncbi:MAG: riboflavin synthase [Flavobacteriales bacterium]|nr:riboflavin synthase [Flavobacteriales bacterium]